MRWLTWRLQQHVLPYWRSWVVVGVPLLLLPLPISGHQEAIVGYTMIIMSIFWMTEALPLAVTGLIPVVVFPLLGVMDTSRVCGSYITETIMMFLGGLMVGLAVEYCNLHLRIALRVVLWVGSDLKWLMLGIMMTTMFLSMWVSNTGATVMILPIVEVLIRELFKENDERRSLMPVLEQEIDVERRSQMSLRRIRVCLMLCVAYAANIGGTGTLVGSPPQLVMKGIVEDMYGTSTALTFASWMAINVPAMLVNVLFIWAWFQFVLGGFKSGKQRHSSTNEEELKKVVAEKYRKLGPMTFHEKTVVVAFFILVNLWIWKDPKFVTGWASLFSKKIGDSVPAIAVVLILFALPAEPKFWCWRPPPAQGKPTANPSMLNWTYLQNKIPWGLIFLLGSGFALSDAAKISGLSKWMGQHLTVLQSLPKFAILVITCGLSTLMTEVVSNTATANIVLPILSHMAVLIGLNPLYLMIPVASVCGYVFLLPVGSPPNALSYTTAEMEPLEMIKMGIVPKIVTVLIMCVVMETLGVAIIGGTAGPAASVALNETVSISP